MSHSDSWNLKCLILNWWVTVSCLTALLWISCYASLISHSFALIPSLSTSQLPLCFHLFMQLSQRKFSNTLQSIFYPLRKLLRALRNNHKTRGDSPNKPLTAVSVPRGSCYLPGPWLPVSTHHLLNTSASRCIWASRLSFSPRLRSWGVYTTYELSSGQTLSGVYTVFHFATHWGWERKISNRPLEITPWLIYVTEKTISLTERSTRFVLHIWMILQNAMTQNTLVC